MAGISTSRRMRQCSWILIVFIFAITVKSEKCSTAPIVLPITNISVSAGVESLGIPIGLGTPQQHFALTPSLMINSTFIPTLKEDDDNCLNSSSISTDYCVVTYGGGFNRSLSRTWTTRTSSSGVAPSAFDRRFDDFANWTRGYDTMYLESVGSLQVPGVPVVVPNVEFGLFSNSPLGLAEGSVFMEALHQQNVIPTKSWGLGGGALCLACVVNAAAQSSPSISIPVGNPVEKNCALQATVAGVDYKPRNGSASIRISSGSFDACIEPGSPNLVLPEAVTDAYATASGADLWEFSDSFSEWSLDNRPPDGNLTFTLTNNFQVTVELRPVNQSGYWRIPVGQGGWGNYKQGVYVLGGPFIDQVYLRYDDAQKSYGVALASHAESDQQDIQALGCEWDGPIDSSTLRSSSNTSSGSGGSDKGALIGGIVGGILGAVVCLTVGWFLSSWWHKRKLRKNGYNEAAMAEEVSLDRKDAAHQLHGDPSTRAEVPGERHTQAQELP